MLASSITPLTEPYFQAMQHPLKTVRDATSLDAFVQKINESFDPLISEETIYRFYLVRHGESEGNKKKICAGQTKEQGVDKLTPEGVEEAKEVGQKLRMEQASQGWTFDFAVSSPSLRAIETAANIVSQFDKQPASLPVDPRLYEKNYGKYDGKVMDQPYQEMKKTGEKKLNSLPTCWDKFNFRFDENDSKEETMKQIFDRVMTFLETKSGQRGLAATHCNVLKSVIMAEAALNYDLDLEVNWFDMPNGSMIVVDVTPEKVKLVRIEGIKFRMPTQEKK